ncbi:protein PATRONUS 1-like [Actinidia eriantha]|uniref:protein PATRONUS 1-like n=1 Tax=Actinidia eriantha TaxID=165200 RepID=UPI0025879D80|nr:protein PATRONUS 1-like [Actinidia eriantha]XP_057504797.1 protein PATRONUS 1-like [Actinidia eriantha]
MTTQDRGLIRNQNLDFRLDVAPIAIKTNVSKPLKNGEGLGGRKALNDISNSGRPSTLQASKKHNSKTVISIGEDLGPSKPTSSFGGKRNVSKAAEKSRAGGRRALSDLTNSGKPHMHQTSKKSQDGGKLKAVAEEQILPHSVVEEQFLHNHQECIKAQRKGVDIDFLKTVGLDNDNSIQLASPCVSPLSWKWKPAIPPRYLEMEEMSDDLLYEDQSKWKKTELPSEQTPCGSMKSPQPLMQWNDYNFPSFMLMESPKLPKR